MNAEQNIAKQKFLGKGGLIFFIALMNMFIPLSTDLYLPALPKMAEAFHVSSSLANLTLVSFFFFFAAGTLLWGPVSDKYGRRTVLLASSSLYVVASFICTVTPTIYLLIGARVVQGIGAGGIIAVSMALVKDCFSGRQRETILALVQTISGLAPMIAPVIGAILLKVTDWRGAFALLTIIGALCLVLSALYVETLPAEEKYEGTIVGALGRLVAVGKNIGFLVPCLIFSLYNFSFMGYISMSAYIYEDFFGMNAQLYSYFFAANAALSLAGPMLYIRFFTGWNKRKFATLCFLIYTISGAFLLLTGCKAPLLFWVGFAPFSLMGTISRPFSTSIMLDQQEGDTGSASSLISGVATVFGSVGMVMASMWSNIIVGLGAQILCTGVISIIGWALLMRSSIPCRGVK